MEQIKGRVWKLGDNVDTDLIYPGKYLPIIDAPEMAIHALEGHDPEFPKKIKQGDIIVAGSNFGCGSSREQAATSLKHAGIACIVAKSFSRIFFRNAINQGLTLVQSKEAPDNIQEGEIITVNFATGEITNTQNQKFSFPPLPKFLMGILEDGGLIPHVKKSLKTQ
jgi:3-isopropylmalate/(R)-2-methylmalate dehydratase small subunit